MRFVHIADVHWRGLSRHEEYRKSFANMFEQCKNLDIDAIVIGGDIVHSKTQGISPELIDCLNWWFTEMSRIAPVHIILGNHDGLLMNSDRQDAISPILRALNLPRVYLYRKSGVYQDPDFSDVNWCAFSPFDESNYNKVIPKKGKINIALYHGCVWGSHTDMDFMLEGDTKMDLFRGFSFAMLGDIHKRQQLDKDGRIWYCGSTIQQNYGESGEKGFLLWDIVDNDNFTVEFFPVTHHNPFVTVNWQGTVQNTVKLCMQNWPEGARYRIRTNTELDPKTKRKLATVLRREHKADEVVYKLELKHSNGISVETSQKIKIEDLTNPETHKKLLREYAEEFEDDSIFWEDVDRLIDDIVPKVKYTSDNMGNQWSIRNMNFDNTFGYGKENSINFKKLSGIVGLFGKNRCGKSSIPGTIMYAMYNSNDRGINSVQHVINSRAQDCSTDVTFSVNGKLYRLERHSVRYAARGHRNSGAMSYLALFEVNDDGNIIKDLSGEQRRDTEKNLRKLIGQPEEFMMTSFAAQGNMNSFIAQGPTERKKTISSFMGLDIYDQMQMILKDESAGVKGMLKRLEAKDWVSAIREQRKQVVLFKERKEEISQNILSLNKRYSELKSKAEKEYSEDFVDPSILEREKKSILKSTKNLINIINEKLSNEEDLCIIEERLAKYKCIKENFPIESYKRRLELLTGLKQSLYKIGSNFNKEKSILSNQKKSVSLLKTVPCGVSFPTCKFIAESHKNKALLKEQKDLVNNLKSEVEEAKIKVSELENEGLKQKITRYSELLKNISDLEMKQLVMSTKIEKFISREKEVRKKIELLEDSIASMELRLDNEKSSALKKLQNTLERLGNKKTDLNNDIFSCVRNIGQASAKIKQFEEESLEYDKLQVEWKVYDFLLKATSWRGIPTYIMSKQIPVINRELCNILQDVAGFTVELHVDDKNTDIFINYGDSRRPIECASGMEKMVSSMALRVALGNVSNLNKSDMFVVDEGFGSLDHQNLEAVSNLLHRFKKYYRLIIIISHVDIIKDSVDEIIEITKVGKDSKVVYE